MIAVKFQSVKRSVWEGTSAAAVKIMKIASVETFPVSIPYLQPEKSSRVHRGGVSDVVVKITTDDGLVGWGESCSGPDTLSVEQALKAMLPFVLDRDPWDNEAIAADVYRLGLWDYRATTAHAAFAGIDMAMWDLCGRACGQPLYRLFGGAVRERLDYFCYLARGTPDELASQATEGAARGHEVFYLKVGLDWRAEEAMLEAVRAAIGPDAKIRIDANEGWTVSEAVHLLRRWHERFVIDFVEAPVAILPRGLMADLRQRVTVPLCANEGLGGSAEVMDVLASGIVDALCFSSYWVGSLRRFHTLAHIAAWHGVAVCKHSHGEFGIAAAAHHHLGLGLPLVTGGMQQTAAIMADDILTEPLPIASGAWWGRIEQPGLGVAVDEAKLATYHEAFLRDGQFMPYYR